MKRKTLIVLGIVILIIGGVWYMKREKDLAELHAIQTDLANYLYNNYRLYTVDKEKDEKLNSEYNKGKGTLTTEGFLKKSDELKEYSDIQKIEFTGFSVGPMKTLKVTYIINDEIEKETSLDTISAETNKLLYSVRERDGDGPFYLEKKKKLQLILIVQKILLYTMTEVLLNGSV